MRKLIINWREWAEVKGEMVWAVCCCFYNYKRAGAQTLAMVHAQLNTDIKHA